jgi:predicted amidohydrolase YtcJ
VGVFLLFIAVSAVGLRSLRAAHDDPRYSAVIHHARIYGDNAGAFGVLPADLADSVALLDGKIAAVGPASLLLRGCKPPACERIDAAGEYLAPGFHDAHIQLPDAGRAERQLRVPRSGLDRILAAVRDFAAAHPERAWIVGAGWSTGGFDGKYPSRRDLDSVVSSRPVVLADVSGHGWWANTAALRAAGIDARTPEPSGGKILREQGGFPSGILLESGARQLRKAIPPATDEELRADLLAGQEIALSYGVTSVEGGAMPVGLRELRAYAELDAMGLLHQHVYLWPALGVSDADFQALLEFARKLPPEGNVHVTAFKGFVDGVIGSRSAWMLEPYVGDPADRDNRGLVKFTQARLNSLVLRANRAGFPVALHAAGDRAARMALDAFEAAQKELGSEPGNRIEYLSVLDSKDAARFARLGVLASIQPCFMYYPSQDRFPIAARLGEARLPRLFPWGDLRASGAKLLLGSDFPHAGGTPPNPALILRCAIQRRFRDGTAFTPAQRLDPRTALEAYTSAPAEALGLGARYGRIAQGYDADLVLLDADPLSADSSAPLARAKLVLLAGRKVH